MKDTSTKTNVVVTGAAGFIGQNLVQRLLESNRQVIGFDLRFDHPSKAGAYRQIEIDLTSQAPRLDELDQPIDAIIHLAAMTQSLNSADLIETNLSMVRNLVESCKTLKQKPVIVLVSSIAAVGPQVAGEPITEANEKHPVSDYGKSKAACEDYLHSVAGEQPASIVRPPIVLGPGDPTGLKLFRTIRTWHRHIVSGRQDSNYAVIDVNDLVTALVLVADHGKRIETKPCEQGIYFASTCDSISYGDLGRLIASELGVQNLKVRHIPGWIMKTIAFINDLLGHVRRRAPFLGTDKVRDSLAGSWSIDSTKIQTELGFQPPHTLRQRIKATIEWYQAQDWLK